MSKQKRHPIPHPATSSQQLVSELGRAHGLVRRRRWTEARDLLEALSRRYPQEAEILTALVNVYYELRELRGYQRACERLLELMPDDPEILTRLAGAYLTNMQPVSALRTFRRFLEHWPDHERASRARATVADLEAEVSTILAELGLSGEDGPELAAMHEQAQALVEQGQYARARAVAEQVVRRRPDFVPALNNLSQLHAIEGQLGQAIATAQRVLALDPGNVHALSNLVRYLCLSGRVDEARTLAEQLKGIESERLDAWLKKAEALSYLGDGQGVLEAFRGAEAAGLLRPPLGDPLLYHLAAVAAMWLGDLDQARRRWQELLRLAPGFELARANLADLRKPVGERHAPWPFNFGNWVSQQTVRDLAALARPLSRRRGDQAITQTVRRYLRQHPALASLVPLLLERGDPEGREFALRLALMAETPELLNALRDFALGQRGPDAFRMEAAQAATQAGLLPPGPTRFWVRGAWQEVLLLGFEIHGEAATQYRPQVQRWHDAALEALQEGDGARAASLIERALEAEPDAPSLLHNLAAAYELQGRVQEAEAISRELHQRHPDYLFARASLARLAVQRGKLDEARALLDPLLTRRRFHTSEFRAFCGAQIELALAEGKRDGARSWLEMLAGVDPDDPVVPALRQRVELKGWRPHLPGRRA
ncbi:MAG: tetratricopeptide repeat protein [Chloroflexi bacterium]|nr:tetratricopeptide repeat protein [Chloroflexota bacterium]